MFTELGIAVINGIFDGCIYAFVALGIVLVYRASGVFNFAQAEFGTTGLFMAFVAVKLWGWNYGLGLAFGLLCAIAMGLLTERLVIHPLRDASRITLLVGTAGVTLGAIGLQFWLNNDTPILEMPKIIDGTVAAPFGASITYQKLIALVVLIAVAVALAAFFRSPSGLALQAAQQEPTAAELVGISVRRVSMMTWGIAAALGGLAGILAGPNTTFTAGFLSFGGAQALLPGFMAAVLAGMRSMPGALVGGLVVGVVSQLGNLSLFSGIPGPSAMLMFVLLLGVLLVRPDGVFLRKASA